jgi:hypothetical protein
MFFSNKVKRLSICKKAMFLACTERRRSVVKKISNLSKYKTNRIAVRKKSFGLVWRYAF